MKNYNLNSNIQSHCFNGVLKCSNEACLINSSLLDDINESE